MESKIKIFENKQVRTAWNADQEEWYFSVVDVVAVLTDSADPNNYWKVLKNRLKKEGSELVTNCNRLKLRSPKDGKTYNTDVLDTKGVLRLVQSIPSLKAEPFKMWLAQVGGERLHGKLNQSATSSDRNHLQLHRCGRYTAGKPTREGKNVNSSKRPAKATSNVGIDTTNPYKVNFPKENFKSCSFRILIHMIPAKAPIGVKIAPKLLEIIVANKADSLEGRNERRSA